MLSRFGAYRLMVKTITMTALLFLAGVGAVLWLMPYEWLWIVLPAVTLLLCAVSVALYWYEVRLPIGRMIASMQAMREGQAVTLDDARRDDEFGQLARAIVEFSIRNQHHLEEMRRRKDDFQRLFDMAPCAFRAGPRIPPPALEPQLRRPVRSAPATPATRSTKAGPPPAPNARSSAHGRKGPSSATRKAASTPTGRGTTGSCRPCPCSTRTATCPRLWK